MASRGQWKVTKEYPEIKIADELKSYRVTSSDENKKHVSITYQQYVSDTYSSRELKLPNTKKIEGYAGYERTIIEYTNTLNPGCSLDINGKMVQITLTDDDEEASGTFEKI